MHAQLSVDHPYNGTVGLIAAATPLAVFANGSGAAQFRRYDGSGSLNDVANWTAPVELGEAQYPKLAGGPSGLFLLATHNEDTTLFARKWNGTTFGAPVAVAGGASQPTLHVFQDASGRLHVVFVRPDANGLHLIHAVSDDGATWRSGTVVTQTAADGGGIGQTRVATAPDHIGVVVWNAGYREIRVAAVGPDAPVDADTTPPDAKLSGKKTQKAGKTISVTVTCISEPRTATATGFVSVPVPKKTASAAKRFRLKKATKRIPKGGKARLKLKIPKKARKAIKRALKKRATRKKVKAKIKVVVSDDAGNKKTLRRTIRLKR